MTRCYRFTLMLSLLPIMFIFSSCGGGGGGDASPESSSPSVVSAQPTGDYINATSTIVITFDKSMDTSTLLLGGALGGQSDGGVWSTTSVADDTLTISPSSLWAEGLSQSLTVDADDLSGSSLATYTATYNADTTPPTASETPAGGSAISEAQHISILFDETIDRDSLALGVDLGSIAHTASISTTTNTDDTLTISPSSAWPLAGITFTVDATDLAGNALTTMGLTYAIEIPAVTATPSPTTYSDLEYSSTIIIGFSDSVDAATLTLGGDLSLEDDGGSWSTTTNANDTFTISPATTWSQGLGRTLTINVNDLSGNPVSVGLLTYNISDPIYVSTSTGDDTWAGTTAQPMLTIGAAITEAVSVGADSIHVMDGTYAETVVMQDGINIVGGYNTSWNFDPLSSDSTIISGSSYLGDYMSVRAYALTTPTTIANLRVNGPNATSADIANTKSSYAVYLNGSELTLSTVDIYSGDGANGANGDNGTNASATPAPNGTAGQNGEEATYLCSTTRSLGGDGGTNPSNPSSGGGNGGQGGSMDTSCNGFGGTPDNANARAGLDGFDADLIVFGSGYGGNGGAVCNSGQPGDEGGTDHGDGGAASANQSNIIGFNYDTTDGAGGNGTLGAHGGGGGGGGGSGGCDAGTDDRGAGGGGGGAGGVRAPTVAIGGKAGGASFGIFAVDSTITLNDITITRGQGGKGGNGGDGGLGQPGGLGGSGGIGTSDSGDAGNGGNGGDGGNGGSGAGGAGGNSYGIFAKASTVNDNSVSYLSGTGGARGLGGSQVGGITQTAGDDGNTGLVYGLRSAP